MKRCLLLLLLSACVGEDTTKDDCGCTLTGCAGQDDTAVVPAAAADDAECEAARVDFSCTDASFTPCEDSG